MEPTQEVQTEIETMSDLTHAQSGCTDIICMLVHTVVNSAALVCNTMHPNKHQVS